MAETTIGRCNDASENFSLPLLLLSIDMERWQHVKQSYSIKSYENIYTFRILFIVQFRTVIKKFIKPLDAVS